MPTAAYRVEAIWEGQQWLLGGFDQLTARIGWNFQARTPCGQPMFPQLNQH